MPEETVKTVSLDDAVKGAMESNEEQETPAPETNEEVEKKEVNEEKEEKVISVEGANEDEIREALNIWRGLKDPVKGPRIVEYLASEAAKLANKENVSPAKAAKTTVEVLKESLPPEFQFLADQLGPGIEKLLNTKVEENLAPFKQQLSETQERQVKSQVDGDMEKFYKAYPDAKELEKEMFELSQDMPQGKKISTYNYLEKLYKLATADVRESKKVASKIDKITKQSKEVREMSTDVSEDKTRKGSRHPTLNEAIAAAMKGERLI